MSWKPVIYFNDLLAKLLFLILPSALMAYFLLNGANQYFSILEDQSFLQSQYVLLGMLAGWLMYLFRFRFWIISVLLAVLAYTLYQGIDRTAVGEFDTFRLSIAFRIFASLFFLGWVLGSGFSRWRYTHFIVAVLSLLVGILMIAKQQSETVEALLMVFLPALFYAVYIIFTGEQIYVLQEKPRRFWWYMSWRTILFCLFFGLVSFGLVRYMRHDFEAAIASAAGKGEKGEGNSLLKKRKDGKFDINDFAQLKSSQGRGDELLFAAHIDNYLPGTDIPNPLYLTAFYYTKFDTSTETFERDNKLPKNDLYLPNVSQIPLYTAREDSSVIVNGMGDKARKVVDIEVYNKKLAPETYLAPNIGFFVQPIAVEKDFRAEFSSAFRAKGYVSELNSAYFIYNASNPELRIFQEQRFEILRKAVDYTGIDRRFMDYYTRMPKDAKFRKIGDLARSITAKAITPVDKVLAIRDYFLSKDADGEPLFRYTDNPGVPDIPNASKLMYFLFENRKGYCAYYAGATLFMLRSLGIPSRITVGFMTIDRSDKNKGWYWYYADQAHAWVQVYFPGYGWMDFDTTVGDDEARESPKPDGTPPLQPPHAWLATQGEIVEVDTLKKLLKLKVAKMLYHDKEYSTEAESVSLLLDVHIASIQRDSVQVDLKTIQVGDSATAVSYAERIKQAAEVKAGASVENVLTHLPEALPIDDVYLKRKKDVLKEAQQAATTPKASFDWRLFWTRFIVLFVVLLCLILLLPRLVYAYYQLRMKNSTDKARQLYWQYRGLSFYLHQLGWERKGLTPLQYARDLIDPHFDMGFVAFMNLYLKTKYAPAVLSEAEWQKHRSFMPAAVAKLKERVSLGTRVRRFLNPLRVPSFFIQKDKS